MSNLNVSKRIYERYRKNSPATFEREISRAPLWPHTFIERASAGAWGRHDGCVNTVAYTDDGIHAITGSDDREIAIWSVAHPANLNSTDPLICRWNSGHRGNVFSARLLAYSLSPGSLLASCAADGRVLLHKFSETSGRPSAPKEAKELVQHRGRAHKLALASYTRFASAGEDGKIFIFDIREKQTTTTPFYSGSIGINIIDFSPTESHYLLSGGNDEIVRVYDVRKPAIERVGGSMEQPLPVFRFAPDHLRRKNDEDSLRRNYLNRAHVTGAQWSRDGECIVATFNDDGK
jgi:WD40 repeat protein